MAIEQVERLGCGRPVEEVWAGLELPPDAHELTCPFCQRARASLAELATATAALNRYDAETRQPSPRVRSSVMGLVRAEVRRGQRIPLVTPRPAAPALLTISEQAVVQLVWEVGDAIPGVRARRCEVRLDPGPVVPGEATPVDLEVTVAVSSHIDIPGVVATLRTDLRTALVARTGLAPRTIDVRVEDLYDA